MRHGVSEPSIYARRKKFGDLGTDDVKWVKKILAERNLEIEVMKEIAEKKWSAHRVVSNKLSMRWVGVLPSEAPVR